MNDMRTLLINRLFLTLLVMNDVCIAQACIVQIQLLHLVCYWFYFLDLSCGEKMHVARKVIDIPEQVARLARLYLFLNILQECQLSVLCSRWLSAKQTNRAWLERI